MLTDDDLTRELGAAFRAATSDLTYTGRTRPPRRAAAVLPATAGTVAVAAVVAGAIITTGHPHPAPGSNAAGRAAGRSTTASPTAGPAPAHPSAASPTPVSETLTLAGFTISYQHTPGTPDPVIAERVTGGLPPGAREIHLPGSPSQVWAGRDPRSGDHVLYIKGPPREDRQLFALISATWTERRLIRLLAHPRAVPLVSPSPSGSPG